MEKRILQPLVKNIVVLVCGVLVLASSVWAQAASSAAQKKTAMTVFQPAREAPSTPFKPEVAKNNVVIIKEAAIQYEIPAGWRTEQHTDATQITSPDGGVS